METEEKTAAFASESESPAHNPDPVPIVPEDAGSAAPGSGGSSGNSDSIENDSGTQTGSPSTGSSGNSGSHSSSGGASPPNTFIELTEEDQEQTVPAEETGPPESEIVEITIFEGFREPTLPAEEVPQSGGTGGAGWILAVIGLVMVLVMGLVLARRKKRT